MYVYVCAVARLKEEKERLLPTNKKCSIFPLFEEGKKNGEIYI